MSSDHTAILTLAQVEATRRGWRLSRNEIGLGIQGHIVREYDASSSTGPRHIIEVADAHRIKYGLFNPGGLDLIGWQSMDITPAMVGHRVAVFTSIDAKTAGYPTFSPNQRNYIREVTQAGGLCYVARRDGAGVRLELVGVEE